MNKEIMLNRLKIIEDEIQKLIANLNILQGGKNELLYWIDHLNDGMNLDQVKELLGADSAEIVNKG